jgi:hypothetical protein
MIRMRALETTDAQTAANCHVALTSRAAVACFSQSTPSLQTYFKDYIGLTDDQIAAIRSGRGSPRLCTPVRRTRSSYSVRSASM